MDVVAELESRFLPHLSQAAARLRQLYPTFRINVGSGSVGSLTAFKGYQIYLEADRPDSANPEPNCVALDICVKDLPGAPTLCSFGVGWGGDGVPPCGDLDLLGKDLEFGQVALQLIEQCLPRGWEYLEQCLRSWVAAYPQGT